jgi:tyrosinase
MADPETAAEDAIYFSFHCFIDLLWAEWQRRNDFPPATSPAATLRGFSAQPLRTVRDFFRCADLGYAYTYTDQLTRAFVPSQPQARFKDLEEHASLVSRFAGPLHEELARKARADFELPVLPEDREVVTVVLKDLAIPQTGSYTLQAYLHPAELPFNKDDPAFQRYYVGYVSLWLAHGGAHHGGHSHHHGHHSTPLHPTSARLRFDLTVGYHALRPEHADLVLTILFVPAPNSTGHPQTGEAVVHEVKLTDIVLETSRR